jgi:predicted  nucleic acid-binding Zn-ribbon protein
VTEPEDRDERITALEADVAALRARLGRAEQDAAAARVLAGGADRDVADLSGEVRDLRTEFRGFQTEFRTEFRDYRDHNNRVLNAMREDLTDLRSRVDERFVQVDGRLDRLDQNVIGVRGVLDAQAAGQQQIIALLDGLIRRQGDARPEQ